ncbi:glycosyltransferase [Aquibium microcysteis]|uniref:glycosyltransferase n=1 Tax=Aquibium microcysteis TaxID=675281 RepID=UPI00165D06A8|nr:glycosyltransferase [Aquibium microcysteis]
MNVYFLPGAGIFGGIKVGFQFAEALAAAGLKTVMALPEAAAPQWFRSTAPVVDRAAALAALKPGDVAIFSFPPDHAELKATPARLVFHCQGTAPEIDPILADPDVTVLTCWQQAQDYAAARGRRSIPVGIAISDCFFYDGTPKRRDAVSFMPRRGAAIARDALLAHPWLDLVPIDGLHENAAAAVMKRSALHLATSVGEWFGLPALEAMAAGCVVLSVPVVGGRDYLRDGDNCLVGQPGDMPALLARLSGPGGAGLRDRLRTGAMAAASGYRPSRHRALVRQAVAAELGAVMSWN